MDCEENTAVPRFIRRGTYPPSSTHGGRPTGGPIPQCPPINYLRNKRSYLQLQGELLRIIEQVHTAWNETKQTEKALQTAHQAISLAVRTGETLEKSGLYETTKAVVELRLKKERKALKKALAALRELP